MERLTFEGNFCDIAQCRDLACQQDGTCTQKLVWERLKAYEDTGLYPESVEALKLSMMGKAISEITEFDGLPIERLRELAEADKDGRVVVLPCKPGAEVWVTRHDKVWPMYFVAPTLSAVCPDMPVHCQKDTCADGPCKAYFGTDAREFGKTVFLSREEAKKALAEMEGKKDG